MKREKNERTTEIVKDLIAEGSLSLDKIAKVSKLPLSEVQKLAEEMSGQPAAERIGASRHHKKGTKSCVRL